MKIGNIYGSNEQLEQLCDVLGVSKTIVEQLEAFDQEVFKDCASGDCCVKIFGYEYFGVYIVKGKFEDESDDCEVYEKGEKICVASLCAYEEGPQWEMILNYLKALLVEEIKIYKRNPANYDAYNGGYLLATKYDKSFRSKKFKIKIPNGYLMIEEKGVENEYPGVYVSFSEDGKAYGVGNIIACIEYDTCSEEIKTETYRKDFEEPCNIVTWEDGIDHL